MVKKALGLVVFPLLLAGCSMTPVVPDSGLNLHTEYLYEEAVDSEEVIYEQQWWTAFNDQLLNELVMQAQQQNISLEIASERIKSARAFQQAIHSLKVPTVSLGGGYGGVRFSKNEDLTGPLFKASLMGQQLVDQDRGNFFIGAGVAWEADLFGRIDALSKAADVRTEQVELVKDGLLIVVSSDLISNYFHLRGAQQRQLIVEQSIVDQRRAIELIATLVDNGMASELDLARARALLTSTEAIQPQLSSAETVHKQRIAIILGDNSRELQARLSVAGTLPEFNGIIPVGMPSELLQRRPDIKARELEMMANNYQLGAAIAARYPSFYLSGSPGLVAGDFGQLFKSDSTSWLAAAGIKWNLFDGGRSKAIVAISEAQLETSVLMYQDSVNTAIAEVEMLLKAYGNNHLHHDRSIEAQGYGQDALKRANGLYEAGLIDQLELIDAQRQLLSLDEQELGARMQRAQLVVDLHKALGGDWSVEPSLPNPE